MKAAGVPAEMLDVTTDPVQGTQIYISYLKAHPDVEAIYSAANYFTEAMVPAFIEAGIIPGKDVFICSHDSTTLVNEYIKDEKVVGATEQQQYLQGFLAVNWMRLHLRYKFKPPVLLPTGPAMITKENVEEIEALAKQGYR
jgi:simple sugar transport system substrate-binding protein